mmetsp:Transcript_45323/g.83857  ORF Transcript_45323/g.83857 Transcript_45323/m.83857 type:complete len:267 (+) Transcript_45323:88-888(+)
MLFYSLQEKEKLFHRAKENHGRTIFFDSVMTFERLSPSVRGQAHVRRHPIAPSPFLEHLKAAPSSGLRDQRRVLRPNQLGLRLRSPDEVQFLGPGEVPRGHVLVPGLGEEHTSPFVRQSLLVDESIRVGRVDRAVEKGGGLVGSLAPSRDDGRVLGLQQVLAVLPVGRRHVRPRLDLLQALRPLLHPVLALRRLALARQREGQQSQVKIHVERDEHGGREVGKVRERLGQLSGLVVISDGVRQVEPIHVDEGGRHEVALRVRLLGQ